MKPLNFINKHNNRERFALFDQKYLASILSLILILTGIFIDSYKLKNEIKVHEDYILENEKLVKNLYNEIEGNNTDNNDRKLLELSKNNLIDNENLKILFENISKSSNEDIFVTDIFYSNPKIEIIGVSKSEEHLYTFTSHLKNIKLEELWTDNSYYKFKLSGNLGDIYEDTE